MEVPQWNYQTLSLHGEAFVNSGRRIFRLILSACFWMLRGSPLRDQTSSPARFIVAQSPAAKEALGRYTPYKFIVKASVIFVCCADLTAITTRERRVGELLQEGAFEGVDIDMNDASITASPIMDAEAVKAYLSMNVAIAIEHIVLKAVDLGLGSCWLGRFDRDKVKEYLALDESIYPVVLLPVGHPDQSPKARPRFALDKLVLKTI